jgi:hypothetical protein
MPACLLRCLRAGCGATVAPRFAGLVSSLLFLYHAIAAALRLQECELYKQISKKSKTRLT